MHADLAAHVRLHAVTAVTPQRVRQLLDVLRRPFTTQVNKLATRTVKHNSVLVWPLKKDFVHRPFSLFDFAFPIQIMLRYLEGLNRCRVH